MSTRLALGALFVLSTAIPAHLSEAQERATPARVQPAGQNDPPKAQLNLENPEVRSALQANISGISIADVNAVAARLARAPAGTSDDEAHNRVGTAQAVDRAHVARLMAMKPPAGAQLSPDNIAPPVRAQRSQIIRAKPSGPATSERVRAPGGTVDPDPPAPTGNTQLAAPPQPYLDVNGFGEELHAALRNSVQGYTMRLRRNGQTIYTLQWNWARRPSDGSRGWNPDRRQNIASVSKFITAIAMVDLLDRKGIDPATPIAQWLPTYWKIGANVNKITFEMLMTHSSGLNNSGSTDFTTMRQMLASGVAPGLPTSFTYENTNFGLQRILIATLGGYVNRNMNLGNVAINDAYWNAATTAAYSDYVAKNVFAPSGVTNAAFTKDTNTALAYAYTGGGAWNSGDLSWRAGSGGWHLSVDDILDIAGTYRYSGKIVSTGIAGNAITRRYGLDGRWSTPAGYVYHKNGSWSEQGDCPVGKRQEQSLLLLMPGGMEMALLVNSPVGPNCSFLRGVVEQVYRDNIIEP